MHRLGWGWSILHPCPPPSSLFTSDIRVAAHQTCALYLNQDYHLSIINMHQNVLADVWKRITSGQWEESRVEAECTWFRENYCITKAANMDLSGWDRLRFCWSIHLALWLCHGTSLYIELSVWTDTMEWGMDENNTPMNPASAPLPTLITLTAERRWPQPPVSPLLCRWPLKGESVPFFSREGI